MNSSKATWLVLALAALAPVPAFADATDVWLTTRAKIALLTTDGISITDVNVDAVDGAVTLHGRVKTDSEKQKATLVVERVDGVKRVRNLLQVVPDGGKGALKASDEAVKDGVETALKSDKRIEGVKVASVNNGVVLLSGRAGTPAEKLRAIELAWNVGGVSRVASEIETGNK